MKNLYILLFPVLVAAGTPASAQMHADERLGRTETTQQEGGNKQKATNNSDKQTNTQREGGSSRSDKKKWAIQIKQGEKWYQLSVSFVF